jgi:predicted nucleotidyltransferase
MSEDKFWERNLILRVLSGSRAHGLARAGSDEDTRGVCIPPKEYLLGLRTFEQHESETHDHVVFALAKFVRLALEANPNIIETLYTAPQHVLFVNSYGEQLLAARHLFLSRRVGERFGRYAIDQLRRMEHHHRWLVNPPECQPKPEDFGARAVEGRYRFPHSDAERAYRAAFKHWSQYHSWRRDRNPERAELEERYGYDTKHACHLFRLLKMGEEILLTGVVNVLRPDAEWLLGVRDGRLSYDEVIHLAGEHEARLAGLIEQSALPVEPDTQVAEALLIELQEAFLFGRVPGAKA